jgi:hypothetical protein
MKMQMENGLPRVCSLIDDDTQTTLGYAFLPRQLCDHQKNLADDGLVVRLQIQNRSDMLTRNDQDMDWRLVTDISEGNYRLVSVNNVTLNSAFNDTTEETIAH